MFSQSKLQSIILTSRIEQATEFYRDILGLSSKGTSDGSLVFDVGGGDLILAPVPVTEATEHTVLGFSVADVYEAAKFLTDRGVKLERFDGFPHDEEGVLKTPGGSQVAWFRDPDLNLLSVVQYDERS
jgi:catechol 2,3-dioxygenase-like lactoylglutathione lyase family enzyme